MKIEIQDFPPFFPLFPEKGGIFAEVRFWLTLYMLLNEIFLTFLLFKCQGLTFFCTFTGLL